MRVESSMRAAGVGRRIGHRRKGHGSSSALACCRGRKQAIFHGPVVGSRLGAEEAESAVRSAGDEHSLLVGQGQRVDSARMGAEDETGLVDRDVDDRHRAAGAGKGQEAGTLHERRHRLGEAADRRQDARSCLAPATGRCGAANRRGSTMTKPPTRGRWFMTSMPVTARPCDRFGSSGRPVVGVPDADESGLVAGDDQGEELGSTAVIGAGFGEELPGLRGADVPGDQQVVAAAGCQGLRVGREPETENLVGVLLERRQLLRVEAGLAGAQRPAEDVVADRGRQDHRRLVVGLRSEGECRDGPARLDLAGVLRGHRLPELDEPVMSAGREDLAGRVDREGLHGVVGRDRFADRAGGPGVPELDRRIGAARREPTPLAGDQAPDAATGVRRAGRPPCRRRGRGCGSSCRRRRSRSGRRRGSRERGWSRAASPSRSVSSRPSGPRRRPTPSSPERFEPAISRFDPARAMASIVASFSLTAAAFLPSAFQRIAWSAEADTNLPSPAATRATTRPAILQRRLLLARGDVPEDDPVVGRDREHAGAGEGDGPRVLDVDLRFRRGFGRLLGADGARPDQHFPTAVAAGDPGRRQPRSRAACTGCLQAAERGAELASLLEVPEQHLAELVAGSEQLVVRGEAHGLHAGGMAGEVLRLHLRLPPQASTTRSRGDRRSSGRRRGSPGSGIAPRRSCRARSVSPRSRASFARAIMPWYAASRIIRRLTSLSSDRLHEANDLGILRIDQSSRRTGSRKSRSVPCRAAASGIMMNSVSITFDRA